MRALVVVFAALVVVGAAAADCASYCLRYEGTLDRSPGADQCASPCPVVVTVEDFVPCALRASAVNISWASGLSVQSTAPLLVHRCAASGSGAELAMQTADGFALTWTYASAYDASMCETTLRQSGLDAGMRPIGLSVLAPTGAVGVWDGGESGIWHGAMACDVTAAPVAPALVGTPSCYTNENDTYTLANLDNASDTMQLQWRLRMTMTTVLEASVLADGANITGAAGAQISCTHNVGRTLVQAFASSNEWAIGWTYDGFASCADALAAIDGGADPAPVSEDVVVIRPGNVYYVWSRDADSTTPLSAREIACYPPSATPSASPPALPSASAAPSASPTPSASALPAPMRPVVPFVDCASNPDVGECAVSFGYYNPNNAPVALAQGTPANQLVAAQHLTVDQGAVPSVFAPGMHNNTFRVRYVCNRQGNPSPSWKLRTMVPAEVADQMDAAACSQACAGDLRYRVGVCAGLGRPEWSSEYNGNDERPVLRCARAIRLDQHAECALDAE